MRQGAGTVRLVLLTLLVGLRAALSLAQVEEAQAAAEDKAAVGRRLALENAELPEDRDFFRKAIKEADRFVHPLLQECALQDCLSAEASNEYLVRIGSDGALRDVFIEPSNRFTACVADGLKARGRLTTPPPRDDYWVEWAATGILPLPEGCREALRPPLWDDVKWWLFRGDLSTLVARLVRAFFGVLAVVTFLLALGAVGLLRPEGASAAVVLRSLALATILVLLAAAASFAVGRRAREARSDIAENTVLTMLVSLPLLSAVPLVGSGLSARPGARGAQVRLPKPGPLRRAFGLLVLVVALAPALGLAWFGAHENLRRLCPTCVAPIKLSWVRLSSSE